MSNVSYDRVRQTTSPIALPSFRKYINRDEKTTPLVVNSLEYQLLFRLPSLSSPSLFTFCHYRSSNKMRFTFAFLAVTSVLCTASASIFGRQSSMPACAVTCLGSADYGTCGHTDNVCLCNSQPFITSTTQCIKNSCDAADLATAEAYSQAICESVGVTLTSTPTATTSSTATSTSTSSKTGGALSTAANAFTVAAALGLVFILTL